MASHGTRSFTFGIELELYLKPKSNANIKPYLTLVRWDPADAIKKNKKNMYRAKTHKMLLQLLLSRDILATIPDDGQGGEDFKKWVIAGDASLTRGEDDGYFSVELVSPILHSHNNWREEIRMLYSWIQTIFTIQVGTSCGTHVHISPSGAPGGKWTVAELRSILKAIAFFNESAVDMVPPERKKNSYAVPNFEATRCPNVLRELYVRARSTGDHGPLFARIDQTATVGAFANIFSDRYWMFNFSNITDSGNSCGTIEFRSGPGSADAETAIHWTMWMLSFAASAVSEDWAKRSRPALVHTSISALRQFLIAGQARLPPASRQGGLDSARLVKQNGVGATPTEEEAAHIENIKVLKKK